MSIKRSTAQRLALSLFIPLIAIGPAIYAQENHPPPVAVPALRPIIKELVEYDEYTGRFAAVNRVEIRSRVSGYLSDIKFREGQLVTRGDVLAIIDQRPFQIALDAANAELAEVQAALDLATIEARRAQSLHEDRAISREEVDQRIQERTGATARVARAKASVAEARLNLEFTEIRAPMAGRIARRLIDVGNLISGGDVQGSLITTVVQEDPIHFYFEVSEADFLRYARLNASGARPTSRNTPNEVRIRLLDETKFTRIGAMDFVDNELDASSGTLEGRALVENKDGFLQPGVFGRLQLISSGLSQVVMVPDAVLQFDQSRQFVFVANQGNVIERRWVTPGPIIDGLRIVREGLSADDAVISGAFHRVRVGTIVLPNFDSESSAVTP